MMWLSLHALHALHGKKIERRLTMEDRESMELGTEQMNDVVSLHVLHALHGKKERFSTENMNESGRRKATVTTFMLFMYFMVKQVLNCRG